METTTFSVPSITCNVCSTKIQQGVRELNGIENVSVDLKSKMVNVEYHPNAVQAKDIVNKVASMGYEVVQ